MTTADITVSGLSEIEHNRQLRRALIASTVGTTIEWYDFLLYGQVTGLVFGKLFFPKSDPLVGVLEAFAIFFIGFVGRPIGAAIFGHWGDRIGRKATLIITLLLMGIGPLIEDRTDVPGANPWTRRPGSRHGGRAPVARGLRGGSTRAGLSDLRL